MFSSGIVHLFICLQRSSNRWVLENSNVRRIGEDNDLDSLLSPWRSLRFRVEFNANYLLAYSTSLSLLLIGRPRTEISCCLQGRNGLGEVVEGSCLALDVLMWFTGVIELVPGYSMMPSACRSTSATAWAPGTLGYAAHVSPRIMLRQIDAC